MALKNAPLVMVWREVSSLANAESIAANTLGWSEIGRNKYAVMYDAGSIVGAYWARADFRASATAAGCSANTSLSSLDHNPASDFLVRVDDFDRAARSVKAITGRQAVSVSRDRDSISLVDADGSYSTCLAPAHRIALAQSQMSFVAAVSGGLRPATASMPGAYIAHRLMVSDLDRSVRFYKNTLGFEPVSLDQGEAIFKCGLASLVLRPEPASGLVLSLERAGRLKTDSLIFHVDNPHGTVDRLRRSGVEIPRGVVDSVHGSGAEFLDPDGHRLGVWHQPSSPGEIDYFPVLRRILSQTSHRAAAVA